MTDPSANITGSHTKSRQGRNTSGVRNGSAAAAQQQQQQINTSNLIQPDHNVSLRRNPAPADNEMQGAESGMDAVIVAQLAEMGKYLGREQVPVAQEILQHMINNLRCSICDLTGHSTAHCWFNGTFYDECRRRGRLDINYAFRAGVKEAKKLETLNLRYNAQLDLAKMQSQREIKLKTAIASKRQRLH